MNPRQNQPTVGILVAPEDSRPPGLEWLDEHAEIHVVRTLDDVSIIADAVQVFAVYDFRTTLMEEIALRCPRLEWIHAASAGVDAVMTSTVRKRGLTVTNSRGVFDQGIAEYVLGGMLAFTKDIPGTLHRQRERRWEHRVTEPVAGRRMLVVGAGSIGRAIGQLAAAAGVEVRGVARRERDDDPVFGHVATQDHLLNLLPWADFIVLSVPLTDETRGLFGEAAIAACRPDARLINVARGGIVDELALLQALQSGGLAGALLDVFEDEPLPTEHPFWTMDHVIVSPHMAGDLLGWVESLSALFVENFERWQSGDDLKNAIRE
ncbi:MAG: D-2-hydroxyacid dehydrogenase [Dehalococcoidia bacterium]